MTITVPGHLAKYIRQRASLGTKDIDGVVAGCILRDKQLRASQKMSQSMSSPEFVTKANEAVLSAMSEVLCHGLTDEIMRSGLRYNATAANARMVAWWLLRKMGLTYVSIAAAYSRDHATIIYGVRRIQTSSEVYDDIKWLMAASSINAGMKGSNKYEKPDWFSFVAAKPKQLEEYVEDLKMEDDLGPVKPEMDWKPEDRERFRHFMKTNGTVKGSIKSDGGQYIPTRSDDSSQDVGRSYNG